MLTEVQIDNLSHMVRGWLTELSFDSRDFERPEEKFTAEFLLPILVAKVATLNKPSLIVRGDGGSVMMPVVWSGLTFYPDLAICEFDSRHLAFEVKILKDKNFGGVDPGGAFSKAIGQTKLYSDLGYARSFGVVFDLREVQTPKRIEWREFLTLDGNSQMHIFS